MAGGGARKRDASAKRTGRAAPKGEPKSFPLEEFSIFYLTFVIAAGTNTDTRCHAVVVYNCGAPFFVALPRAGAVGDDHEGTNEFF
jgi:hypothetical protein